MNLKCCKWEEFKNIVVDANSRLIMFGAGAIGQVSTLEILKNLDLLDKIDCYLDNNPLIWGSYIESSESKYKIKSPQYLEECSDQTVILLNISRFPEVIKQLENMPCTQNMDCYVMPMMLIHNFCLDKSKGNPVLTKDALIPKKLHYMWLGRNSIPENLQKCINSWKKYCPDYEIIEWNEDNYDITKHSYMKDAYDIGAYGFVPDYARIDILYNEGGFYLDTDVEIKRNIDDLRYQQAFCGVEKWQIINFGGLSGAVKEHPMLKEFLDSRQEVSFFNQDGSVNKNTCGFYDTRVAITCGYRINGETQCINGMNIYASDYFQPFDYMSGVINETENTHSIHWFNGGWLDEKMKRQNKETKRLYLDLYNKALENSQDGRTCYNKL
ncbi:MAG: hypothetical protein J6I76_02350 [Oribacterium sp.]|nr:hypothetical protein [Oribacterium sp.]